VLSHGAVLAGRADLMPSLTAFVGLVVTSSLAVATSGPRPRMLLLVVAAAILALWWLAPSLLLFTPPAALNVAAGVFFASTLREGREPRIATFARLERGEALPPDLSGYARTLTWIWSILLFGLAAIGLLLAVTAPLRVWSAFVNVASYLAIAALFVGEYAFRRMRYRQYRHGSLRALIRIVARDRRARATGARAP